MEFEIKACKTKAAYSAKPLKKITLDLDKLKTLFTTLVDTPILLVINVDSEEIIVHNHGELTFKKLKDENKIKIIAEKIYETSIDHKTNL